MRKRKSRITLNDQEISLIKLGLEFVLDRITAAALNPELQSKPGPDGYNRVRVTMLKRLRAELVSKGSGGFRLGVIQVAAGQLALRVTRQNELWRKAKTCSGTKRKREPEAIIGRLEAKLENYRRCRKREDVARLGADKYIKQRDKWQAFLGWLSNAIALESAGGISYRSVRAVPAQANPAPGCDRASLFDLLLNATRDVTKGCTETELRYVASRARDASRRSPLRYDLDSVDSFNDPDVARRFLVSFILKNDRFRHFLNSEYEPDIVKQSARAARMRAAMVVPEEVSIAVSEGKAPSSVEPPKLSVSPARGQLPEQTRSTKSIAPPADSLGGPSPGDPPTHNGDSQSIAKSDDKVDAPERVTKERLKKDSTNLTTWLIGHVPSAEWNAFVAEVQESADPTFVPTWEARRGAEVWGLDYVLHLYKPEELSNYFDGSEPALVQWLSTALVTTYQHPDDIVAVLTSALRQAWKSKEPSTWDLQRMMAPGSSGYIS